MKLYHGQEKKVRAGMNLSVDLSELEEMASKGLLSLSVQLGMKALEIMLEDEVTSYAGQKGKHSNDTSPLLAISSSSDRSTDKFIPVLLAKKDSLFLMRCFRTTPPTKTISQRYSLFLVNKNAKNSI